MPCVLCISLSKLKSQLRAVYVCSCENNQFHANCFFQKKEACGQPHFRVAKICQVAILARVRQKKNESSPHLMIAVRSKWQRWLCENNRPSRCFIRPQTLCAQSVSMVDTRLLGNVSAGTARTRVGRTGGSGRTYLIAALFSVRELFERAPNGVNE